jgi:hypothetical protein
LNPPPASKPKLPAWASLIVLAVAAVGFWLKQSGNGQGQANPPLPDSTSVSPPVRREKPAAQRSTLLQAIAEHRDNVVVEGSGRVAKVLPDDNEGDRHQRLLIDVGSDQTILIAHNIDLAQRINVRAGDTIDFKGIYIWNDRGGVVHWTHHDPSGRHPAGWLRANGQTVQ